MSPASLQDKLRRLRRTHGSAGVSVPHAESCEGEGITRPSPPTAPSSASDSQEALGHLERSLLGEAGLGLTLKERLERLVSAASRGRRVAAPREALPIEEVISGLRIENDHGEFFLSDYTVHLDTLHGDVPLGRLRTVAPGAVQLLAGEEGFEGFDLQRAVFLDTETTGLAGGAGTAAFLIGVGFVDGDVFRVRQYFMRDYHEEAALLAALARDLAEFEHLVTFNGKMFDIPLLDARFRLNHRMTFPLAERPHLDLLHPSRRLWKARLESCRLVTLEERILGVRRHADIPGEQIPEIFFDYVRRRDARAMARVFTHNRLDIVSLAALAALACQWVGEGIAEDPRDVLSLARVLERGRADDRSLEAYRRAAEVGAGPVRTEALMRLALHARRTGDHETAIVHWEAAGRDGDVEALRALAIDHEHRLRDFDAAQRCVERGLALLEDLRDPAARRQREGFLRRSQRLEGKRQRARSR